MCPTPRGVHPCGTDEPKRTSVAPENHRITFMARCDRQVMVVRTHWRKCVHIFGITAEPRRGGPTVATGGRCRLKTQYFIRVSVGAVREPPEIRALLEAPLHEIPGV